MHIRKNLGPKGSNIFIPNMFNQIRYLHLLTNTSSLRRLKCQKNAGSTACWLLPKGDRLRASAKILSSNPSKQHRGTEEQAYQRVADLVTAGLPRPACQATNLPKGDRLAKLVRGQVQSGFEPALCGLETDFKNGNSAQAQIGSIYTSCTFKHLLSLSSNFQSDLNGAVTLRRTEASAVSP